MASAAQRIDETTLGAIEDAARKAVDDRERLDEHIRGLVKQYKGLAAIQMPLPAGVPAEDYTSFLGAIDDFLCTLCEDTALPAAHASGLARQYEEARRDAGARLRVVRAAVAMVAGSYEALNGEPREVLLSACRELESTFPAVAHVMAMSDAQFESALAEPIPAPSSS